MSRSHNSRNFYEILGVSSEASLEEIRNAYKRLSLQYHPDKNPDKSDEAKAYYQAIVEAHTTLSNSSLRSNYDGTEKKEEKSTSTSFHDFFHEYEEPQREHNYFSEEELKSEYKFNKSYLMEHYNNLDYSFPNPKDDFVKIDPSIFTWKDPKMCDLELRKAIFREDWEYAGTLYRLIRYLVGRNLLDPANQSRERFYHRNQLHADLPLDLKTQDRVLHLMMRSKNFQPGNFMYPDSYKHEAFLVALYHDCKDPSAKNAIGESALKIGLENNKISCLLKLDKNHYKLSPLDLYEVTQNALNHKSDEALALYVRLLRTITKAQGDRAILSVGMICSTIELVDLIFKKYKAWRREILPNFELLASSYCRAVDPLPLNDNSIAIVFSLLGHVNYLPPLYGVALFKKQLEWQRTQEEKKDDPKFNFDFIYKIPRDLIVFDKAGKDYVIQVNGRFPLLKSFIENTASPFEAYAIYIELLNLSKSIPSKSEIKMSTTQDSFQLSTVDLQELRIDIANKIIQTTKIAAPSMRHLIVNQEDFKSFMDTMPTLPSKGIFSSATNYKEAWEKLIKANTPAVKPKSLEKK